MPRSGKVGEKWEVTANEYDISFKSDENVLRLDCCDGCTTVTILKITEWYTLDELPFNKAVWKRERLMHKGISPGQVKFIPLKIKA